ncbi:M12 family metallopeptidase [Corallococcus sp. EGB]|uniref:M12 family metallopeptidase n=1 Tax=Corallococcus sp. EGB TaxID=1521117 RepID=UPI001CBDAEBE|nr:M12 family metallopeptidase [Corallococcus sp. EGB]
MRSNQHARWIRALTAVACLGTACRPDDAAGPATPPTPAPQAPAISGVRSAWVRIGPKAEAREVKYEAVNGLAIFEGDIVLGTVEDVERESPKVKAQAANRVSAESIQVTGSSKRWPNGVVPYVHVYGSLDDNYVVNDAIRHWQRKTGLRFVPISASTPSSTDHVYFVKGQGCTSAVGRQGGRQFITLEGACGLGAVIHELGHAIGFWHEQSREDRNDFIDILWDNIESGKEHNFEQQISNGDDFGAYDFGSIMHYGTTAFGRPDPVTGAPMQTIRTKGGQSIGQRSGLSTGDVASAASMYPGEMKGNFEEITSTGYVKGWTFDTASPEVSATVHIYIDGPAGSGGTYGGSAVANVARPDVNTAYDGILGNHGFYFPMPAYYRDGQNHTLYVYGIDVQGQYNPLLTGSPRTFNLPGAFGTLDNISNDGTVTGWALDLDSPAVSIPVYYSIDGNPASVGNVVANLYRSDVKTAYPMASGANGFSFRIPDVYVDGQEHTLRIYALDQQGRNSPLLVNAPKTFRLAMPSVYKAGVFAGTGSADQLIAIDGSGYGPRVSVSGYVNANGFPNTHYQEAWNASGLLNGWHNPSDIKLVGDFRGLGYDQMLFINTDGLNGRVMVADFRDGVAPAEVRYLEPWGLSGLLDGWHDPEDLQLAGDFLHRGHDQVLFFNRSGTGGRVMIADFSDGVAPAEVGYQESWTAPNSFEDCSEPDDKLYVGDFQHRGYDQVLCLNRSGTGARVKILDFSAGVGPAQVRYEEASGAFPLLDGLMDADDNQAAGDFRGLGYDQLLLVNNGTTGTAMLIADFLDGVAPAEVRYSEAQGVSYYPALLANRMLVGDFRGLGHDQVLYGGWYDPSYATIILDFSDGVAPPERLFQKVELN